MTPEEKAREWAERVACIYYGRTLTPLLVDEVLPLFQQIEEADRDLIAAVKREVEKAVLLEQREARAWELVDWLLGELKAALLGFPPGRYEAALAAVETARKERT